jgi:hypothetical protein
MSRYAIYILKELSVRRRWPHMEQELLSLPEYLSITPSFKCLVQSLVFCVMFCTSLSFCLLFSFSHCVVCPLICSLWYDCPFDIFIFGIIGDFDYFTHKQVHHAVDIKNERKNPLEQHSNSAKSITCNWVFLFMVFNATFNNTSVISWR